MKVFASVICLLAVLMTTQPAQSMTLFGAQTYYVIDMSNGADFMSLANDCVSSGDYNGAYNEYLSAAVTYYNAAAHAPNSTAHQTAVGLAQTALSLSVQAGNMK